MGTVRTRVRRLPEMRGEKVKDYIWQNCCDCQEAGQWAYCNHHELLEVLEIMSAQLQEIIDAN